MSEEQAPYSAFRKPMIFRCRCKVEYKHDCLTALDDAAEQIQASVELGVVRGWRIMRTGRGWTLLCAKCVEAEEQIVGEAA